MGAWSVGLYGGDFAADLRAAISAVARLPYDGDALLALLIEAEPRAANDADDADHTTFWFVVADRFAKLGIPSARARDTALALIESGADRRAFERLGARANDLAKRDAVVAALARTLAQPVAARARATLKKPQPFVLEAGDVVCFPAAQGKSRNPYFKAPQAGWSQDGWGAFAVLECDRAFGYLAWYRLFVRVDGFVERPTLADVRAPSTWFAAYPGTLSRTHYERLGLERIGTLQLDLERVREREKLPTGIAAAVSDICISNRLSVVAPGGEHPTLRSQLRRTTTFDDIDALASDPAAFHEMQNGC